MVDQIVFAIFGMIIITVGFVIWRNAWLFNRLMKLSDDEALAIKLTYGQMLSRFWIWDVRKFIER